VAEVAVTYNGVPQFNPIEGTSLAYATNTQDKVIQADDEYYLCRQGIWFRSVAPQGPWATATSVPQAIYAIPPSSPVYNVTYVTQGVTANGTVLASYTAGYLGAFVTGGAIGPVVVSGSGYNYQPQTGILANGYPAHMANAATYGAAYATARGAYGLSETAYGAYGSATGAAQYNPYTGTYARGGSVSTRPGSASAAQAYNPYTGAYGAHASGSNPSEQWGASTVSRNGETATGQHTTTAEGTRGSVQTSAGGMAGGVSTAYGNTAAAKGANGDVYAGHDGNVYRNTGSGWQQYNSNGNWSNVSKPASSGAQHSAEQERPGSFAGRNSASAAPEGLHQEFENRQRGEQSSQHFSQARAGGFGASGGRRR
jgi:hypothetical protein